MIKKMFPLVCLFILAFVELPQAQTGTKLYKFVPPSFGNGDEALKSYFLENIILKARDWKYEIRGVVSVTFTLTKEGELRNFNTIDTSTSFQLNQNVVKCLKLSKGLWHKATINDHFCDINIVVVVRLDSGGGGLYAYYVNANFDYIEDGLLLNQYYNIGSDFASKGMYQEAVPYFDVIIKKTTSDVDALYNRGVCHMKLGDMSKACEDWQIIQNSGKPDADKLLLKYCSK